MLRLHEIALIGAWAFFFLSGFSLASCVVLVIAGFYAMAMVLPKLLNSGRRRGRHRRYHNRYHNRNHHRTGRA